MVGDPHGRQLMSRTPFQTARVSSPAATGGAGTFLEQHVNAGWLTLLLVRGFPPILTDCRLVEVHLQTEHKGWQTDDFLLVGETGAGARRRLAGQVKRSFRVSYADEDFKEAILDAWRDFRCGVFDVATDQFVIVTLRGTDVLLTHLTSLLDCARASTDGADFEHRLTTPGFVHSKVVAYCDEVRKILDEELGRAVTFDELRDFLRILHLLSLDLTSATAQTESQLKTLLANSTADPDPVAAATNTWNELLRVVGDGAPQARSYRRDDLPEGLRVRHTGIAAADNHALRALRDHSDLILRGIRSVVGVNTRLSRKAVVSRVVSELESVQVVLLTAPSGGGKSVVARSAAELMAVDSCVFAFRAEEFATSHLDETFSRIGTGLNAKKVGGLLALHDRKIMVVESVERLLEATNRAAFTDLMTLLAEDRGWRVILTCRDYSTDLVRSSFLESTGIVHSVISVPPFDDSDLDQALTACPELARPLGSGPLRRLLANPYFLDMAARMPWPEDVPLPESERGFRLRFWRDVVRDERHGGDGMPRRREQAFVEIALRRARALSPYARCEDLDSAALERLRNDSLIAFPAGTDSLASAAHDVLEDWGLLHWIEQRFTGTEGRAESLCEELGTYPAIRRSFKNWLSELVDRDPNAADQLFDAVTSNGALPAHFRDDTLVSFLRSSRAPALLDRNCEQLFANGKAILRRVMHLLRVGCVTTPSWLGPVRGGASLLSVPDGASWASVLSIVRRHLNRFQSDEYPLLIGLIEDWGRGINWRTHYPEGFEDAGAIALALLPHFDNYHSEELRKRVLQVLVKIPRADEAAVRALLQNDDEDHRDRIGDDVADLVLHGMEGMAFCRDLPDDVIAFANRHFLLTDDDVRGEHPYGSFHEIEPIFGIRERRYDFFPPSAYRGPFLFLLRSHAWKALRFIVELMNHSAEWYSAPRVEHRYVELPVEITLTLPDGRIVTQWCNDRLWNTYRGTCVSPYLLQTAMMGLEHWLLELCESGPQHVETVLLYLLRESRNVATTAVVASVVTAFPRLAGEAGLVLLRSPECVVLDRHRMVNEAQAPTGLNSLFPQSRGENQVYASERKESDGRPHRKQDLEMAAITMQVTSLGPRVQEVLDAHRAALPPAAEQTDADRVWRLALHRMDLRQYRAQEPEPAAAATEVGADAEAASDRVFLELAPPEGDIQEMLSREAPAVEQRHSEIGMLMWGIGLFSGDGATRPNPDLWREKLEEARAFDAPIRRDLGGIGTAASAKAYVAVICVRDHWDELSEGESAWCLDTICGAINAACDVHEDLASCQRNTMSGDRAAAWVVSSVIGRELPPEVRTRIMNALASALTHGIDEVGAYAAAGIAKHLWAADPQLALRCVNAVAAQAIAMQSRWDEERRRPFNERQSLESLKAESTSATRSMILGDSPVAEDTYRSLNGTNWIGSHALVRLLAMVIDVPNEAPAKWLFGRTAEILVGWWELDERGRDRDVDRRPVDVEAGMTEMLERFVLRSAIEDGLQILRPIIDSVDAHPQEASHIVQGLVTAEDRVRRTETFWRLWDAFAEKVRSARWLRGIDNEHARGREMMWAIFLGHWWHDDVRHWCSLEGFADRVDQLLVALPPSASVLDCYTRFLYHVGERSLPRGFIVVADRLRLGDPKQLLSKGNTVFMLESLLRRHVYGRPMETKRDPQLRAAVLHVLDCMVDVGSSAAYRMRDDFVTPVADA